MAEKSKEKKKSKLKESGKLRYLIIFVSVVLIVLMFPKGESIESEVTVGSIWIHDDLIAPFSFAVKKDPEVYQKQLHAAAESVYPIFIDKNESEGFTDRLDSLDKYNASLLNIIDSTINNDSQGLNPTFLPTSAFRTFVNLRKQERNLIANRNINIERIFSVVESLLRNSFKKGIYQFNGDITLEDSIAVRSGKVDRIEPLINYMNMQEAEETLGEEVDELNFPPNIKNAIEEYARHFIYPDIVYSSELTKEEINQAQDNVSRYRGIVNENERIIAKHDRITKEAKLKIESYKEAKGEQIGSEGFYWQLAGKFLHISFLVTLLIIYLYTFRKKIYYDNGKILLICLIIIFLSFITFLVNQIGVSAPVHYLIFIPAASMLLTIIFDSRVGFYATVILVLITGALRGNDYSFAAMNLFAGALSVYTVRDIKNRSQIFRSFLFILIGYTTAVLAFGMERFASPETILIEFAFAGSNALISPVLTYGLLIFFERFFNITTDLTLLELSNFDRPLLKELSRKAPGTFNHSMTIGTIAETAAEKIDANPLLARVGAYYHDIGKTLTPQNFVENQLNNQNIHEDLTPEESVNIIIKHVQEGIRLAEEENLPDEIVKFIPMHHGTMVISYFYEKAKQLYGEEKVNVENYKYPGPKPDSKETAIVMLGDGCESAVRSITEPDPVKVENVIDKIIKSRIDDGQLDDSPLTFNDISKIKEAFVSILLGQHHKRIKYPKQEEMESGNENKNK